MHMPPEKYSPPIVDKVFSGLAKKFQKNIYGSLKGKVRLAVLERDLAHFLIGQKKKKLKILDMGGGVGHLSIALARKGHEVWYNDAAQDMANIAKQHAVDIGIGDQITWRVMRYQDLIEILCLKQIKFDLILCHAVIEWLARPERLIHDASKVLTEYGQLSLCFYNPAGKTYRNLIRGNFDYLNNDSDRQPNADSFTPHMPPSISTVRSWLNAENFCEQKVSGIRVFSDYVVEKRGGLADLDQVIAQELKYSEISPYRELGRYIHLLAHKCASSDKRNN